MKKSFKSFHTLEITINSPKTLDRDKELENLLSIALTFRFIPKAVEDTGNMIKITFISDNPEALKALEVMLS